MYLEISLDNCPFSTILNSVNTLIGNVLIDMVVFAVAKLEIFDFSPRVNTADRLYTPMYTARCFTTDTTVILYAFPV